MRTSLVKNMGPSDGPEADKVGELTRRMASLYEGHNCGVVLNALLNEYVKLACFVSETPDQAKADLKKAAKTFPRMVDHFWTLSRALREWGAAEKRSIN